MQGLTKNMTTHSNTIEITVSEAIDVGRRLDQFLSDQSDITQLGLSRKRIQDLIQSENVTRNGKACTKQTYKTKAGDVFIVTIPPAEDMTIKGEDIPLTVLFEDEHLIVVNKPTGMATHPAAGSRTGTLVHALLHHCKGNLSGIGGVERPGIVHRLDKGTSGVMVVAKNDIAHQHLSQQFKDRTLDRRYLAICYGVPTELSGEVEGNIGRSPKNRKKMAVLRTGGKTALTTYKVTDLNQDYGFSLIDLKLHSGRTHQIRVHMTHIGHPLVGDPTYGRKRNLPNDFPSEGLDLIDNLGHQALHAYKLAFEHPKTGEFMTFTHGMPEDMQNIADFLRLKSSI